MTNSFKEELEKSGRIVITPIGSSMWPMMRSKSDQAVLIPKKGRLKRKDIALFERANGEFVIHRVIKTDENSYTFCGDGEMIPECNITDDKIIAVLDGYFRNDKYFSKNSIIYRFYSSIWSCMILRKMLLKCAKSFQNVKHM